MKHAPVATPAPQKLVFSLAEAAKVLGISKRTLERERDRGRLRCLKIGRIWKVRAAEIESYLKRLEDESRKFTVDTGREHSTVS